MQDRLVAIAMILVVAAVVAFLVLAAGPEPDGTGIGPLPEPTATTASPGGTPEPTTASPTASAGPVILVGAGDIADCGSRGDEATAMLLDGIAGTVFTAGDNAYDSGTPTEFAECYEPSWGRHRERTRPAPGNHDYETAGATGYYAYFGTAAAPPFGYYSYDVGTWHVVALNSVCDAVGGCGAGSVQDLWLRADLAANPAACTLAYWHHPRFSSGDVHGSDPTYEAFWQVLYDGGADVVVNGHDHLYERFAPQTPGGTSDPERGIRQFTVGTGGVSLYAFAASIPNSEVRDNSTFGVLELTLGADDYAWRFVPVAGGGFTDEGTDRCH